MTGLGLTYALPPQSFETRGQKVRDPSRIVSEGLATCLDTSLLIAAALEATGLNPVIIVQTEHAFAGVWLTDKTFSHVIEADATEIRKAIAAREFLAFETSLVTSRPPCGFEHAIQIGKTHLREAKETEFQQAIDIHRARASGIRPLANHRTAPDPQTEPGAIAPAALPTLPDFGLLPGENAQEEPTTPEGRIERWQRKLLDLSLRNRLLNFKDTKQTLPIVCDDIAALEDRLADGKRLKIHLADR